MVNELKEWSNFFVATASASAALTGLIFVAVSINIAKILSSPKLPERALISISLLMMILIVSLIMLVPGKADLWLGIAIGVIAIFMCILITKMDRKIHQHIPAEYKRRYFIGIVLNQLSILPYLAGGVAILFYGASGIYVIVPGILFSFLKGVIDAWILLIEINR